MGIISRSSFTDDPTMLPADISSAIVSLMRDQSIDLIYYTGAVERAGYDKLCKILPATKAPSVALILMTYGGGDPDAGFRIARALQHNYQHVSIWIPGSCKSAGTLICLGAHKLVMADQGELGPLDVQFRKQDELFDYGSGLDVIQSLGHMQRQAMSTFRSYVLELQSDAGMSTKTAADFATKLATGLFSPIYSQIDPVKLGEIQRSLNIALSYGEILAKKSGNLKDGAISALVAEYPSHSFVIDRAMAREHFRCVENPDDDQRKLLKWLYESNQHPAGQSLAIDLGTLTGKNIDERPSSECGGGTDVAERSEGDLAQPEHEDGRSAKQEHSSRSDDGAGSD